MIFFSVVVSAAAKKKKEGALCHHYHRRRRPHFLLPFLLFSLPLIELAVLGRPDERARVRHPGVDEREQARVLGLGVALGERDFPDKLVVEGRRGAELLLAVVALFFFVVVVCLLFCFEYIKEEGQEKKSWRKKK